MSEQEKKPIIYRIFSYPPLSFAFGCVITALAILFPLALLGGTIVTAIVLYVFRDNIDFDMLIGWKGKKKKEKEVKRCPECLSSTKHKKTCSHSGEKKS
jgi:hypothetical protein